MKVNINNIKPKDNNPREFNAGKLEELKKSIKDFPEMLSIRPIVINKNNEIIGGNMRYVALKQLGYKEVEVEIFEDEEKEYEFLIKDNLSYGDWDWVNMSENYITNDLVDWGVEVPIWYKDLTKEDKKENKLEDIVVEKKKENISKAKAFYLFYTKKDKEEVLKLMDGFGDKTKEEILMEVIKNNV